jgi:IS1 family transposase
VGDRSAKTFAKLWKKIEHWKSYFWITDGYKGYPKFIPD